VSHRDASSGVESVQSAPVEVEVPRPDRFVELAAKRSILKSFKLSDFQVGGKIGAGGCGEVLLVREKQTSKQYAMKVIQKSSLYEVRDANRYTSANCRAIVERDVLRLATRQENPFVIHLHSSFQSTSNLFLITELVLGFNLLQLIQRNKVLNKEQLMLYSSEMVLALQFCHNNGYIYRYFLSYKGISSSKMFSLVPMAI
jgi:serine/threonine protein kinase